MKELPVVPGGSGPHFVRHSGVARSLPDAHSPSDLQGGEGDADSRASPSILLVGDAFGGGEPPDQAAERLSGLGIRVVISIGFDPAFLEAAFAVGLLPVTLDEETLEKMFERSESDPEAEWTVDLEAERIVGPEMEPIAFSVEPRRRQRLLLGLTDLDEMRRLRENVDAFRDWDRNRRPWIYDWR